MPSLTVTWVKFKFASPVKCRVALEVVQVKVEPLCEEEVIVIYYDVTTLTRKVQGVGGRQYMHIATWVTSHSLGICICVRSHIVQFIFSEK